MTDPLILAFIILVAINLLSVVLIYKRPSAGRLVGSVWAFFCVAGFFSPAIWTLAWHVRHGNHIQFGETNIRVPFRWIVTRTQAGGVGEIGVELAALQSNILSAVFNHGYPDGLITLGPSAGFSAMATSGERLKHWQGGYSKIHSNRGDIVTGPMRLNSSLQDVACMETVNNSLPKQASASCLFPETAWTADFGGSLKDVDTFFDVIRNVNPAHAPSR
jgi:hypothetical protein